MLLAVAVQRNGSLFGHSIAATAANSENAAITTENGIIVINSTTIAPDIKGYGGAVPLEITIADGKISEITALKNAETEAFFEQVRNDVIPRWIGTQVDSVARKEVDGVSGATFSSNAVNATVKATVAALPTEARAVATGGDATTPAAKYFAILIVVLCASTVPLFTRNRIYRYTQLLLNVAVLGLWSGTFLSYELFVNYIANGIDAVQSLAVLLMLAVAFIYPYFGKMSHYCTWICPLGSLQEIAGKSTRFKLKMSARTVGILTALQEWLWFALMFVMCSGIFFKWMGWELFTAFIFEHAATGVVIVAVVFVLLSVVVNRPYCRFVCPTGCLLQITQNPNK